MLRNAETLWSNEVCPNVPTLVRNTLSQLTTTENLSSAEVERAIDQQRTRLRRGSFDTEIRAATPGACDTVGKSLVPVPCRGSR